MCYLKNHQVHPSKVGTIKIAVWSADREQWAGVSKATRKREDDVGSGTYQIVEIGDTLIISQKNSDGVPIVSAQIVLNTKTSHDGSLDNLELLDPNSNANIGKVFQNVESTLWAWLLNLSDESDGFLPPGIGWDGKLTLYDQRKRENIRNLLYGVNDKELTAQLIDAGQISAGSVVPSHWCDAETLPYDDEVTVDTMVTNITTMVYCIQWFKDNEVKVVTYTDNLEQLKYLPISKDATKVMIGEINETDYNDKKLTRWRIYSR